MNISLRRGERIFINGAVIRVDRKVCVELLNDVTFLLETHVMQADDASTPIKQLYFAIQTMLMSPGDAELALDLCRNMLVSLNTAVRDRRLVEGLAAVVCHIDNRRTFDALKTVRPLFSIEAEIIGRETPPPERGAA